MARILVTGAAGFVGQAVVDRLAADGHDLTLAVRQRVPSLPSDGSHRIVRVGDISGQTDWGAALDECSTVVHLAGQTPGRGIAEDRFRMVNDEATRALTMQAAQAGVTRFVFMSSMSVVTARASHSVVSDAAPPAPLSDYGRSKLAGERHVADFGNAGGAGISLRPVTVYGAGGTSNWRMLQRLASSGLPLPFGSVRNRRSMLSVSNLADAVAATVAAAHAQSGSFVLADAEAIALADVLRRLRDGMGLPHRLLPVPPGILSRLLRGAGLAEVADSLLGDLVVDSTGFVRAFQWTPREQIAEGIRRSGAEYARARAAKRS